MTQTFRFEKEFVNELGNEVKINVARCSGGHKGCKLIRISMTNKNTFVTWEITEAEGVVLRRLLEGKVDD